MPMGRAMSSSSAWKTSLPVSFVKIVPSTLKSQLL